MVTLRGEAREIDRHTLGCLQASHLNDCADIAVSEPAMPGLDIWHTLSVHSLCTSRWLGGQGVRRMGDRQCIEVLIRRYHTACNNRIPFFSDPARLGIEVAGVAPITAEGDDRHKPHHRIWDIEDVVEHKLVSAGNT